jgi:hypothetical protein
MSNGAVPHQFNVPSPLTVIVPGMILSAAGIHSLAADVFSWAGAIMLPIGVTLLMMGVVTKAVAWGIALEHQIRND